MPIFDYIVIAFALLFTAAAMRLIGGLSAALDPAKRYTIHYVFVFITLLGIAFSFWNFYGLREVAWTLPKFLVALSMPGLLYYVASVVIPENPNDVASWREYYYAVRVRYFSGMVCWVVVASIMAYILLGIPWVHPARIGHTVGLILMLTGALSSSPRVHGALAVLIALMLLAMTITIAVQPGWLHRSGNRSWLHVRGVTITDLWSGAVTPTQAKYRRCCHDTTSADRLVPIRLGSSTCRGTPSNGATTGAPDGDPLSPRQIQAYRLRAPS